MISFLRVKIERLVKILSSIPNITYTLGFAVCKSSPIVPLLILNLCIVSPAEANKWDNRFTKDQIKYCWRVVDSIRIAEGIKSNYPYGILGFGKHNPKARQYCYNTVTHSYNRFLKQNQEKNFIRFLSKTYCPIGALNDPTGLNKNWIKNVSYHMGVI